VDLLLEAKAEVDATNEHGWTPLQARWWGLKLLVYEAVSYYCMRS
jgi:hypothetical protein